MNRAEWLAERRKGIGGSDVAAVLGMSPWKTPFQVYLDKRGEGEETPDSEPMLWGRVLEPVIRQQYAERTGRIVRVPETIIAHPKNSFMLANLDGLTDDHRVVEVKTARVADGWGDPGTDEIPVQYLLQVQHYMAVVGVVVADVAVLIGGSDFRIYEVHADSELQEMMIDSESEFWQRVVDGRPPEPVSFSDVQAMFGRISKKESVEATGEVLEALSRLKAIRDEIKAAEAREEATKAMIMKAMGTAEALTKSGKDIVTWKMSKPPIRFDTKGFQAAHPDLYRQFVNAGEPSRRFLLK